MWQRQRFRYNEPRHQSSFPCTRESIHPHTPDAAFGNALATTNNYIEQNQQRHYPIKTQHTAATPPAVIPVHTGIHSSTHATSPVWKRTSHNQQLHRAKPTTPLSHKNSAHCRHATSCHSRAHGNPFIHTRHIIRLETHLPQPKPT